jgi:hypothetical protein
MPDERRYVGEDLVDWAVRTDRILASAADGWRERLGDERRRIIASAGPGGTAQPSEVEATLQILTPVPGINAPGFREGVVLASAGATAPPLSRVEQLDRALFGPTREERYAEQDAQAERELAEIEEADRIAASQGGLTPEEMRVLFGDERKG